MDGRAVSVPMIQSGIAGGSIEIGADGSDPLPTLAPLAAVLRSGPLPVALIEISVEGPSPAPLRSAPTSTALPSEVTIVPSLELAPLPSDVAIRCAPPIDVAGPQIGCQEAIDSALSVLPANRPRIAEIRFVHSCDDTSQYLADCAVQAFGWVSIQFVDGRSIAIEVVLGSRPRLLIDKRHVPDAPPFPLSEARPGDRCTDPWARGDAVTIGIDPVLADPVWAYTSDLTPVEIRFGPGLRSVSGPIPLILTSHTVVLAHSGTTMLPGRDVMLPGVDVCRTADGALLVVERDS